MKKLLSLLLLIAVLVFGANAFADVGCYNNATYNSGTQNYQATSHCGPTSDINWVFSASSSQANQVGMVRSVPVLDQNLFAAGVAQGDYVSVPSTTTAVPVGYVFIRKVIDSDSNPLFTAGTLANGYPGQILTIYVAGITPSYATTGGNYTITPTTSTEWSSIELSAKGDILTLMYVDNTVGWVPISVDPASAGTITVNTKS